jgi:hypothetical protein
MKSIVIDLKEDGQEHTRISRAEQARENGKLGGRPRKTSAPNSEAAPPETAAECDRLIAIESVHPAARTKRISIWESLRASYKETETRTRQEAVDAAHEQRRADEAAVIEAKREKARLAREARKNKNAAMPPSALDSKDDENSWESASEILNAICDEITTVPYGTAVEGATAIKNKIANSNAAGQALVSRNDHLEEQIQITRQSIVGMTASRDALAKQMQVSADANLKLTIEVQQLKSAPSNQAEHQAKLQAELQAELTAARATIARLEKNTGINESTIADLRRQIEQTKQSFAEFQAGPWGTR